MTAELYNSKTAADLVDFLVKRYLSLNLDILKDLELEDGLSCSDAVGQAYDLLEDVRSKLEREIRNLEGNY